MRLFLLSNSTNHGQGFLDHAVSEVRTFLGDIRRLTFVPFALADHAAYTAKVSERLAQEDLEVEALPGDTSAALHLSMAEAVFVGGGNTFRLLERLQRTNAVETLRHRVRGGMPYVGSSAGTNLAAPTIRTTNDMPIVQPRGFESLGLVPFQINPHYVDPDPTSTHMGESREARLDEYLEENELPVLGLREGAWLRLEDGKLVLEGAKGARLFRRHHEPKELPAGSRLDELMGVRA